MSNIDDMPVLGHGDSIPQDGVPRRLGNFTLGACKHWPDNFISRQTPDGENATYQYMRSRATTQNNAGTIKNNFYYWDMPMYRDMVPAYGQKNRCIRSSFMKGTPVSGRPNVYWIYWHTFFVTSVGFWGPQANICGHASFSVFERILGNAASAFGIWPNGNEAIINVQGITCPHGYTFGAGSAYVRSGYAGVWLCDVPPHQAPAEWWPRCGIFSSPGFCSYSINYDGSQAWCGKFHIDPLPITWTGGNNSFGSNGFSWCRQACEFVGIEEPELAQRYPAMAPYLERKTALEMRALMLAYGNEVPYAVDEIMEEDCYLEEQGISC